MIELRNEDIEIEDPILPFEPFIKVGIREQIEKELDGTSLNNIETNAEWKDNPDFNLMSMRDVPDLNLTSF